MGSWFLSLGRHFWSLLVFAPSQELFSPLQLLLSLWWYDLLQVFMVRAVALVGNQGFSYGTEVKVTATFTGQLLVAQG